MAAATQISVKNNKSYQLTGALGGAGGNCLWTGTVTDKIGAVGGTPYTGAYTAYYGALSALTAPFGATTWNSATLTALGAPNDVVGLGTWGNQWFTTAVDTIAYAFSNPVPAGASFMLVDPGASYPEYSGTETYKISATYNNAAVSTSGWTFAVVTPSGAPTSSTVAVNAAGNLITVTSYAGSSWPDSMVVITPNTPISSLSVTATTTPYDFWALTLPHMPSALVFQSVDGGPAADGVYATWQVNGAVLTGGGVVGDPGPGWTYEGSGDFQGNGGTDLLFRNGSGSIAYWAVSGTTIFGGATLGNPGAQWSIVGVGDFNADGVSDMLFEDAAGDLAVWLIGAAGLLASGQIGSIGHAFTCLATADFTGSGYSDILFESTGGVYYDWFMHGTTPWASNLLGVPPAGDVYVGVGDLTGNGHNDIVFENPALGRYDAWIMSGGSGVLRTVTLCQPGVYEKLVSIGAYTVSNVSDLVFENTVSGELDDYVINAAAVASVGALGDAGPDYAVCASPYARPSQPAPTIVFDDAAGDIATWSVAGGVISGGALYSAPGSGYTLLGAGDFDGSGQPDMLFANANGFALWLTNGTQITGGGALGSPGGSWQFAGIGDFNGDGISDLLFVDSAGDYARWLLNGSTNIGGGLIGNPGPGYTLAGIADLTGDGTSDLILETAGGAYVAWFIDDCAYAGSATIGAPGAGWTLVGTGDFNGDGKADLLFENSDDNYMTWDMNGASVVGGGAFSGPGAGWNYLGVADIQATLPASVLFTNASTGVIAAYNMTDATVSSTSILGAPGAGYSPAAVI